MFQVASISRTLVASCMLFAKLDFCPLTEPACRHAQAYAQAACWRVKPRFGKNQKEAGEMFAAAVGHLACKGFCICFLE